MMNFGHFETELQMRYPDSLLVIRNMCDGGNTPGFRPHSGTNDPWAFPGANKFQNQLATPSGSQGHFEKPDQWLTRLETDIILACFGFSESYEGEAGLDNFKGELDAFIKHTLAQSYNGATAPQLALVSPIAFQDLSDQYDFPKGEKENVNLLLYTDAIKEVATNNEVLFVDAFAPSKNWFSSGTQLTSNGSQLNEAGYQKFSTLLVDEIFGGSLKTKASQKEAVHAAVTEKNWMWHNDFKIPNGVHVFGRRYKPFGPDNYPFELKKIREMTANRDQAIWKTLQGESYDLAKADANTTPLPAIETNYKIADKKEGRGPKRYLYEEDALNTLKMAPGYKAELFASEKDFPDLANPVQLAFDNKGRLWVAVMPSYPHYKPGDEKPNDKLLILEDTDGDGKADKQTIWVEGLQLPTGFEFSPEGVFIAQGTNLKLFTDTDGDDKADKEEIIFSGFDDHDTHHVISAFCADPSGAIYMSEGLFLHTNVETSYGTVRGTNGGFYRFNPTRRHLERTSQVPIPNPWGIAFDQWGQHIYAETSGPNVTWMIPGSVKSLYGISHHKGKSIIEDEHRVRPTSGLEFIYSSHFPDEVQGDFVINNAIGFLGAKQHTLKDDGAGYKSRHRLDLFVSDDGNFRPVDMEIAPDGSMYVVDWHNVLVGHMQHNARDPLRDHQHGRIYRITYPSRPLVEPAQVAGADVGTLLENLKLPEYRTRYRSRRELRGRDVNTVLEATKKWVANLDATDPNYERWQMEALWVSWGMNKIDQDLLRKLLKANDFKVRAAAVKALRYNSHEISDYPSLLMAAAKDDNARVRLDAMVAASWMEDQSKGLEIVEAAGQLPLDDWAKPVYATASAHLQGKSVEKKKEEVIQTRLAGADREMLIRGKEIYSKEGFCETCHQADGKGLRPSGFPPLKGTKWVLGNEERLIKIVLKGMYGPLTMGNHTYPGKVPMTPYEGMMNDEEVAAVLTYIRNSFGNEADPVKPETVAKVRAAVEGKKGFYTPEELLAEHPMEKVQ